MTTSLVTGAAGFIGSHVVDELVAPGHDVPAVDNVSGGFQEDMREEAPCVEGSVRDASFVHGLAERYGFDDVFHLAAYAAEGLSHVITRFNYTNNLINASVNAGSVRCFVFASSIAVYGRDQAPMRERESTVPVPEDPYGIAKLAGEQELRITHEMFGLDSIIFRPHNVYGERQHLGDRYRNVGGDAHYSINELARAVAEAMGVPLRVPHLPRGTRSSTPSRRMSRRSGRSAT